MNKLTDSKIKNILLEDYKHLKKIYNEDKILGVFTYGKVNYGFAEDTNDMSVKMIYLPGFEELCYLTEPINTTVEYNNHFIKVIDIRLVLQDMLQQEPITMETFFSDYYIITPKFEKVFMDNIYTNREVIFHCNKRHLIQNLIKNAKQMLQEYKESNDLDLLFEVCRIRIFCFLYLSGAACENCINLKKDFHIKYLWAIKHGDIEPDIIEIEQDFEDMLEQVETSKTNHSACEELSRTGVVEIMKIAMTITIKEDDFLKMLTDTEKSALKLIVESLDNGEGNISITQLTQSSNISRPVFKNILQKLKDMQIAEVNNMGVKGMYIKIIDGTFLTIDKSIDF